MANPATLAIVGMGASAGAGIVGAIGSVFSGESSARMYEYQASVAKMNQQIAKQNSDYAKAAGEVEAQESGMKTRYIVGQQKAAQGASGLDVNRGSAPMVRSSQLQIGAEDQAIVRSNAARKAYGYEVEAAQSQAQAGAYGMAAKGSRTAGWIGAAGSILGGSASVSNKWLQYRSNFGSSNTMSGGGMGLQSGNQTGMFY